MSWVDLFGADPDFPLLADDAVAEVEKAMARAALVAWSTAALARSAAEREALTQHADAMSRWSERLRMAQAGRLTSREEWMVHDDNDA